MRVRVNLPGAAPGAVVGFDGQKRRRQGEEFDFEGHPSLKWMEPVDDTAKKAFAALGWKPSKAAADAAPAEAGSTEPRKKGNRKKGSGSEGGSGDSSVI